MSNYAIMRFAKYKVGSVANIERHQKHRERLRNRKHPERENENHTWQRGERTMSRTIKKAIKEQERTTGKKVRKDANVLCELVLTFSPEMEDKIKLPEWVKANFAWVRDTFGKGKMIRADLNRDETTTHLHCFVIMTDEQGKFNSSRFFNKKSQVIALQDSYAAEQDSLKRNLKRSLCCTGNVQSRLFSHSGQEHKIFGLNGIDIGNILYEAIVI